MIVCQELDCHKIAHYNFPDNKNAIYCNTHCITGMIRIGKHTCKCGQNVAQYNYKDLPPEYCLYCKTIDMINTKDILCKCHRRKPTYNYPYQSKAEYCRDCKFYGMIPINKKKNKLAV